MIGTYPLELTLLGDTSELRSGLSLCDWRIPTGKMKGGLQHIVPSSRQATVLLREIQPLTGQGRYVFPSPRINSRPMSSNAVLSALHRMGYAKDEMSRLNLDTWQLIMQCKSHLPILAAGTWQKNTLTDCAGNC